MATAYPVSATCMTGPRCFADPSLQPEAFSEGDRVRIVSDNNPSTGTYTNLRGQLVAYTFSSVDNANLVIAERSLVLNASVRACQSDLHIQLMHRSVPLTCSMRSSRRLHPRTTWCTSYAR